jgi:hypothetical protein
MVSSRKDIADCQLPIFYIQSLPLVLIQDRFTFHVVCRFVDKQRK